MLISLSYILMSILFGVLITLALMGRAHQRELQTWRTHYEGLLTHLRSTNGELMQKVIDLSGRMSEMRVQGLDTIPQEEGSVWPMDNEYELMVEQERNAEKVRSIHGERLTNG